jgi:hypothetical protein
MQKMLLVVALALLSACPPKQFVPLPANRTDTVTVAAPLDGVEVELSPKGYSGWVIKIDNQRNEQLLLRWDESSFVANDRIARGRLIRGRTKLGRLDVEQVASPIPRRARFADVGLVEDLLGFEPMPVEVDRAGKVLDMPSPLDCEAQRGRCVADKNSADACERMRVFCTARAKKLPRPPLPKWDQPQVVTKGVGRLVLVFETPRGRENWEAWISFDGSKPPEMTPQAAPPAEPATAP